MAAGKASISSFYSQCIQSGIFFFKSLTGWVCFKEKISSEHARVQPDAPHVVSLIPYVKWTYTSFQCQMSVAWSLAAEVLLRAPEESEITMKEAFDGVGLTPRRNAS